MKAFCVHCLKEEEYITKKIIVEDKFKDVKVTYFETIAYCVHCGEEVYVKELEESNIVAYQDAYRQKVGLVKLSTVLQLPLIYNIGVRPLSKVLGFGEITYTRYCEGYMPRQIYSDMLLRIERDPAFFLDKLEAARDKISKCAYSKAKSAAEALIEQSKHNEQGIDIQFTVYESSANVSVERMIRNKANFEMSYCEPYSNAA